MTIKALSLKIERATTQGIRKAAREMAIEIPKMIRERVRRGQGLLGPLAALSQKYIKQRELSKNLSNETSPRKSNLTATGQMLNSIIGQATGGIIRIFFSSKARRKEINGKKSNKTNAEIARYADDQGRPFSDLLPREEKALKEKTAKIVADEIRRVIRGR